MVIAAQRVSKKFIKKNVIMSNDRERVVVILTTIVNLLARYDCTV